MCLLFLGAGGICSYPPMQTHTYICVTLDFFYFTLERKTLSVSCSALRSAAPLYMTVNTPHEATDSYAHSKPHVVRVTARCQLSQLPSSGEKVCVTGLFWTASHFFFCFSHVCVVWVCVSVVCLHMTRDPGCKNLQKKISVHCLASFFMVAHDCHV